MNTSICALCLGLCLSQSSTHRDLNQFIASLNWDASKKGGLLTVNPERTLAKHQGTNLVDYDRKLVTIGHLSAVVPMDMTLIDDSFKEPNMYDGLTRDAKVLYLLSTMTTQQVQTATKTGIGLHDLQGEQVKVMKSLLPERLLWKTLESDGRNTYGRELEKGEVPANQMDQVKLKIQYGLILHLSTQNNPNGYSPMSIDSMAGRAGSTKSIRDANDSGTSFGTTPRQLVTNRLKPSQLNYDLPTLAVEIDTTGNMKLDELLSRISRSTGVEIHADVRVGYLPVAYFGKTGIASDLLKAVAMGVSGTYRKVGSAFVLTCDLVGMGARKLRFAAWKGNADKQMEARKDMWRKQVVQSGALSKLDFDTDNPNKPNDRMRADLEKVDDKFEDDKVPSSDLTPEIRDTLSRYVSQYPTQAFMVDRVGLHSQIQFAFVLPNGKTLRSESSNLGEHGMFVPPSFPKRDETVKVETFKLNPSGKYPLVVRAETANEARSAGEQAISHGLSEVWIETHHQEALAEILKYGVPVHLVVRPWAATEHTKPADLDRDILGDSGSQLAIRRSNEPDWVKHVEIADRGGIGPPKLYDLVHPLSDGVDRIWDVLKGLAHTTGLSGLVLLDTAPIGYEKTDTRTNIGGYERWLTILNPFGYSDAARLSFLRAHGMDPIDIREDYDLGFEIDQPFFPDYDYVNKQSGPHPFQDMREMEREWREYRAQQNLASTQSFVQRFTDLTVPIQIMGRFLPVHMAPEMNLFVVPWTPGSELPTFDPTDRQPPKRNAMPIYTLAEDSSDIAIRDLGWRLRDGHSVAIDVSSVRPDRLGKFLDKWFPKVAHP